MTIIIFFCLVPFLVSALICAGLVLWGPRDRPGGHKVHLAPTPVAGGLGIWIGTLTAIGMTSFGAGWHGLWQGVPLVVILLASFGAVLGLVDDIKVVPTSIKMLLLSVAAAMAVPTLQANPDFVPIMLPPGLELGLVLVGSWLWIMVCANAVNFMDGSNGLAIGSVTIAMVFLTLLIFQLLQPRESLILTVAGVVGCLGFLVWNLPGKLFAGDTGSLFIGLWFAGVGLIATHEGANAALVALCLLPILADVIATIVWRARHDGGLRVLAQPHRHHLYQWLRRSGFSAMQVALIWWAATAVCGALALTLTIMDLDSGWTPLLVLAAMSILALVVIRLARKKLGPPPETSR